MNSLFQIRLYLCAVAFLAGAFLAPTLSTARADNAVSDSLELQDTLVLKSGNQLTGKVLDRVTENKRDFIVFRTDSGSVYKFDVRRLVKRVHEVQPEYRARLNEMDASSPDDHWKIYEWCKETDKSAYKREIEHHLRRIVELDPTDDRAMKLLGFDRFDGRVIHKHHKLSGHGYVRIIGGWVPEKFLEIQEYEKSNEKLYDETKIEFNKWTKRIGKISNNDLQLDFKRFANPYVVGLLYQKALKENRDEVRSIYVEALANVEAASAQNALVHFAIRDSNARIRDQALSLLQQPQFNQASVAAKAAEFLRDKERGYVIRAANLIRETGHMSAFKPLVNALQTVHEVAPAEHPNRMNSAFNSGGTSANQFDFGGGKKAVKRKFDNREVLAALERITGQTNLGFDRDAWESWYSSQFTIYRYDVSGDDE